MDRISEWAFIIIITVKVIRLQIHKYNNAKFMMNQSFSHD